MQAVSILAQPQTNPQIKTVIDSEIAIRGAAHLDQVLYRLLDVALLGSKTQKTALLERAVTRRRLALCTGLIDQADFDDLTIINHIRNRFAHDYPRPGFHSPAIASHIGDLSSYHDGLLLGLSRQAIVVKAIYRLSGLMTRKMDRIKRLRN